MLSLLNFDPLLHLLQSTPPLRMLVCAQYWWVWCSLVRPCCDAIWLQDGAGRGDEAIPSANTGGQGGGGPWRSSGRRSGHRSWGRHVWLRDGSDWRVGWKGRVRVHFKKCASYGLLQHDAARRVFVKAAELLRLSMNGLQENLVDSWFCSLRVWSLGLVVVYVVCLWNSLLQQLLYLVRRSVKRRKAKMDVNVKLLAALCHTSYQNVLLHSLNYLCICPLEHHVPPWFGSLFWTNYELDDCHMKEKHSPSSPKFSVVLNASHKWF